MPQDSGSNVKSHQRAVSLFSLGKQAWSGRPTVQTGDNNFEEERSGYATLALAASHHQPAPATTGLSTQQHHQARNQKGGTQISSSNIVYIVGPHQVLSTQQHHHAFILSFGQPLADWA